MIWRRRPVLTAAVAWMLFAFVVWNVVFDRLVVLAGRRYSYSATVLYRTTGRYLHIDDVMRPAVAHAAWVASSAAGMIAIVALLVLRAAAARERQRQRPQLTEPDEPTT
jgi:hypothetical protein